jgi:RNA polymerase sigma factor (sigma-70 family)
MISAKPPCATFSVEVLVEEYRQMDAETLGTLVQAAEHGDEDAWEAVVERFSGLVWAIARSYGLSQADAADVSQTTWLRLVENLPRLRDPTRVGAWLATTARRECLRRQRVAREAPAEDDTAFLQLESGDPSPESLVLTSERHAMVWQAFGQISPRCRELLRVLVLAQPALSYQQVADALGLQVGSVGPTRLRCLALLQKKLESGVSTAT